jgi:hypothetical protein
MQQNKRINTSRFFYDVPETNIETLRTGPRQSSKEIKSLGGTGKVYKWSMLTDQLSRPRFK